MSEFLSVVTRIPRALSTLEAVSVVNEFQNLLRTLYPDQESNELLLTLLQTYQPTGLHIHDFEIACIGIANGIKQIATFNEKDFNMIDEIKLYTI